MSGRRHSLAWRLAVGLSAGLAVVWIGAVAIAASAMQRSMNSSFDETLRQSAFRLLPLANAVADPEGLGLGPEPVRLPRPPGPQMDVTIVPPPFEMPVPPDAPLAPMPPMPPVPALGGDERYITYYLLNQDGDIILRADDASEELPLAPLPEGFARIAGRSVFSLTDRRTGYGIVVVEQTDRRARAIATSMAALVWPLLALVPFMGLGIWLTVRQAMRPVASLSAEIGQRGGRNLAPLNADGQPAELVPIADAVASLLDRLRSALDAERAFAASSAHELRTPIAGALAQTQLLAAELAAGPGNERVKEIETALRQLSVLSERLLQLSRLEAGFARSETPVDLLPALRLVVRDLQKSEGGDRVSLSEAGDAGLTVAINLDAFAIAVRNLIQNALLHGAAGSPVEVHAGPGASIRVVSDGRAIPPDVLATLAQPFVRGPTAAKGSGLGLSIVRSIADQTGGTLTLRSPAPGRSGGLEAAIAWPKASPSTG